MIRVSYFWRVLLIFWNNKQRLWLIYAYYVVINGFICGTVKMICFYDIGFLDRLNCLWLYKIRLSINEILWVRAYQQKNKSYYDGRIIFYFFWTYWIYCHIYYYEYYKLSKNYEIVKYIDFVYSLFWYDIKFYFNSILLFISFFSMFSI